MTDLLKTWRKATRLVKKRRPLSAALAFQDLLTPPSPKPARKRAKAPRPSALELLGAIRAPTESLGNAPKAAVATQNDSRNAATEAARDRAREVEALLRVVVAVVGPPVNCS